MCTEATIMDEHFTSQNLYEQLTQGALAELDFLKLVDNYPSLYGGPILDNAIRRYECFWLPLVEKYTDDNNESGKDPPISLRSAPIDVAWVWHIHMLAPLAYRQCCLSRFGRILPHDYRSQNLTSGKQLWQQAYPLEPFDLGLVNPPQHIPEHSSQLQYDISSAAQRQSKFYYNVSLPHYKDAKFLKAAVDRYKHYFHVIKTNPHLFAVPCYDFDLIWHAHQLYPQTYFKDTKTLLGYALDHDDTEHGGVAGLYIPDMQMRKALEKSRMTFSKRGAMYRGESIPKQSLKPTGRFFSLANEFKVHLVEINTHLTPSNNYEVIIKSDGHKVKAIVKQGKVSLQNDSSPVLTFSSHSFNDLNFRVILYQEKKFGRKKMIKSTEYSLEHFIREDIKFKQVNSFDVPVFDGLLDLKFQFEFHSSSRAIKLAVDHKQTFSISPHIVAQVLSEPTLMLMSKNIHMSTLPGEMTTNQIKDHRDHVVFYCKIVHSAECMLSAVEILDNCDRVEASAHYLDSESLPRPHEVSNGANVCVTEEDEFAMLIRSRNEDYGICVGKKNNGGGIKLKFYSLNADNKGWCRVEELNRFEYLVSLRPGEIELPQIAIDLKYDIIIIRLDVADDTPQCLAIFFAVQVLNFLCWSCNFPYSADGEASSGSRNCNGGTSTCAADFNSRCNSGRELCFNDGSDYRDGGVADGGSGSFVGCADGEAISSSQNCDGIISTCAANYNSRCNSGRELCFNDGSDYRDGVVADGGSGGFGGYGDGETLSGSRNCDGGISRYGTDFSSSFGGGRELCFDGGSDGGGGGVADGGCGIFGGCADGEVKSDSRNCDGGILDFIITI